MAGHIKKRPGTNKWRARHPDPLRFGGAQIERTFTSKAKAEAWLDEQRHAVLLELWTLVAMLRVFHRQLVERELFLKLQEFCRLWIFECHPDEAVGLSEGGANLLD